MITVLAGLLESDKKVQRAFLCRDNVEHVYKVKGEGNHFCGYHNIQMVLSSLDPRTSDCLEDPPHYTVIQLQNMIEKAWDMGINAHSRIETGGIKNTRKHIGTSEAQALFKSLDISCEARGFGYSRNGKTVYMDLLDYVEQYFLTETALNGDTKTKVHRMSLAPIYLQRPRHSLTVVGLEKRHDGSRALLVFDPGYRPPKGLKRIIAENTTLEHSKTILKAYRKEEKYLRRYRAFETLAVDHA